MSGLGVSGGNAIRRAHWTLVILLTALVSASLLAATAHAAPPDHARGGPPEDARGPDKTRSATDEARDAPGRSAHAPAHARDDHPSGANGHARRESTPAAPPRGNAPEHAPDRARADAAPPGLARKAAVTEPAATPPAAEEARDAEPPGWSRSPVKRADAAPAADAPERRGPPAHAAPPAHARAPAPEPVTPAAAPAPEPVTPAAAPAPEPVAPAAAPAPGLPTRDAPAPVTPADAAGATATIAHAARAVRPVTDVAAVPAAPTPAPAAKTAPAPAGVTPEPPAAPGGTRARASRGRGVIARVIGALFGAFGWKRVNDGNALKHDTRAMILTHVRANPGAHLRAIARDLDLTPQNAAHHVRTLEKCGHLGVTRVGRRACYYAAREGRDEKDRARSRAALTGGVRRRVLHLLTAHPGLHQAEIARRLDVAHGSVSFAVKRLVETGLLTEEKDGNRLRYTPCAAAARIRVTTVTDRRAEKATPA